MSDFLSNGANLAAVAGAIIALLVFGWRVLRRLAGIYRLLEQAGHDHKIILRHDRRLGVIERTLGLPTQPF